jgi:hypothetical protein
VETIRVTIGPGTRISTIVIARNPANKCQFMQIAPASPLARPVVLNCFLGSAHDMKFLTIAGPGTLMAQDRPREVAE